MDVTLVVLLTNRCNKDCSFCFMSKGTRELSYSDFVTSFQMFYYDMESRYTENRYSIVFMGGEPLLEPEICTEMIKMGYCLSRDKVGFRRILKFKWL